MPNHRLLITLTPVSSQWTKREPLIVAVGSTPDHLADDAADMVRDAVALMLRYEVSGTMGLLDAEPEEGSSG